MKQGMTLEEVAKQLTEETKTKRDFRVDTAKHISMEAPGGWVAPDAPHKPPTLVMGSNGNRERFGINTTGHAQLASKLDIPKKYYDRLLASHPGLLAENVNALAKREPKDMMVRTLAGNARAFLGSGYRTIDNYDLAEAILPQLLELQGDGNLRVESCMVTERKLYIKVIYPNLQGEIQVGDPVCSGSTLTNSEIGEGRFGIDDWIMILSCLNGMKSDISLKKYHVGRKHPMADFDSAVEVYSDATKELDDRALFAKAMDVIRASFDPTRFQQQIERYKANAGRKIEREPVEFVELTAKKYQLNQAEKNGFLEHYIKRGDYTQYGAMYGITSLAQESYVDYDRSIELETLGGRIMDLNSTEWKQIAA